MMFCSLLFLLVFVLSFLNLPPLATHVHGYGAESRQLVFSMVRWPYSRGTERSPLFCLFAYWNQTASSRMIRPMESCAVARCERGIGRKRGWI
ncbi:hypothetical protein BDW67DRAFT_166849 [Aspergillus spinulosporus]